MLCSVLVRTHQIVGFGLLAHHVPVIGGLGPGITGPAELKESDLLVGIPVLHHDAPDILDAAETHGSVPTQVIACRHFRWIALRRALVSGPVSAQHVKVAVTVVPHGDVHALQVPIVGASLFVPGAGGRQTCTDHHGGRVLGLYGLVG